MFWHTCQYNGSYNEHRCFGLNKYILALIMNTDVLSQLSIQHSSYNEHRCFGINEYISSHNEHRCLVTNVITIALIMNTDV